MHRFSNQASSKGSTNARDLVAALEEYDSVDESLAQWNQAQIEGSKHILVLGQQMEQAFIWSPLDFATTNAETTAAWWKSPVTFPESLTQER